MTVEDAVRTVTPRANATCYKRLLTSVAFQASHARARAQTRHLHRARCAGEERLRS